MAHQPNPQAGSAFADTLVFPPLRQAPRLRAARLIPWSLGLTIAVAITLAVLPARGQPPAPDIDDGPSAFWSERLDRSAHEPGEREPSGAPFSISLGAQAGQRSSGESGFAAMLFLGLPLDRLAARRSARTSFAEGPAAPAPPPQAGLKPLPRSTKQESPPPPSDAKLPPPSATAAPSPLPIPEVVTPALARAAVHAALRKAKLLDPSARIDAIAARAHRSAILPELRLRVSRTMDEGQTLSPTEYDPTRRTATGGTSLWLEARATWRLDRLVFADEEIALEKLREHRAEQQSKLCARVLERLFAWQKATALAEDPSASPEENLAARLHALEAEAELALLTGGWFSAWRAGAVDVALK